MDEVHPTLLRFADRLLPPLQTAQRVFVPLCGKTMDLTWLAVGGHRVFGVEVSQLAVEQYFSEAKLPKSTWTPTRGAMRRAHFSGNIGLLEVRGSVILTSTHP